MKKTFFSFAFTAISCFSFAQFSNYWNSTSITGKSQILENKSQIFSPKLYSLNIEGLKNKLKEAPKKIGRYEKSEIIISFPNANGILENFKVQESSNFEPALAAKYPEIKSYAGENLDNTSKIYFSISPLGLSTMELYNDRSVNIIEPYTKDLSTYVVYNRADKKEPLNKFECQVLDTAQKKLGNALSNKNADDNLLRTYRLALSCTGEYAQFFGGTKALALAAMNNTVTRVNAVFETDFDVHMNIIAGDDAVIYTNASTDPYDTVTSASSPPSAWNLELQKTLSNVIGNANYDIGHMFGASGGGGNAGCIGCVCTAPGSSSSLGKGAGITSPATGSVNASTTNPPSGDGFDIDYVAHEMGHQFGANHTFTFSNESGSIAQMEPGSGSTIMGYAGITNKDLQPHSDALFHAISIQQVTDYVKSQSCSVNTSTGNSTPLTNAGADYTIPSSTPFMLTGTGSDANGDTITYIWEEIDNQNSSTAVPSATKTSGVDFRSFTPSTSAVRYFPMMASILAGSIQTNSIATTNTPTPFPAEILPSVSRTLNFRLTVRDNKLNGGSNSSDDMKVTVSSAGGPFKVTSPNTAVSYAGGSSQIVTWNVASTISSPINTANVDILISTNGGSTWSTLLPATPNDGSQAVIMPNISSSNCRIMVKANGNIFFDVSDSNFMLTASANDTTTPTAATLTASGTTQTTTNLSWSGATDNVGVTGYDVYKGTTLLASTTSATTYSVVGLTASTNYSFTVKAKDAAGNISVASNAVSVTTLAPTSDTTAPSAATLTASGTTSSGTTLSWSGSTDNVAVTGYDVYQATTLIGSTTSATTYSVTGLSASSTYTFTVKAKDAAGNVSAASNILSVTTSAPSTLTYCASQGNVTTDEKIGKVVFGTISNTSTGSAGYENFTALSTNVTKGAAYTITITPNWSSTKYKEGYAVWIDYNQNGTFESAELVYSKTASTTTPIVGSIAIPSTATLGATRMRVSMKYNGIPTACETFSYGQVEDYTVVIGGAANKSLIPEMSTKEMSVYPNPLSGSDLFIKNADSDDFRLFDMSGKLIKSGKIENESINVNSLPKGVYLIQVGKTSKRFIKK